MSRQEQPAAASGSAPVVDTPDIETPHRPAPAPDQSTNPAPEASSPVDPNPPGAPTSTTGSGGAGTRWMGTATGLVTAAVGLGVGHLVAGFHRSLKSPLVSVGDRVVDLAPTWLKDLGISLFGTNDKVALIVGTALLLVAVAASAGVLAVRGRRAPAVALVVGFSAVGMVAGSVGRDSTAGGWIPAALGGVAATLALLWLTAAARRTGAPRRAAADHETSNSDAVPRRRFLFGLGAATVTAAALGAVGQALRGRFTADLERAGLQLRLRPPQSPLPDPPADPAGNVAGLTPLFVPNKDFYRIDTALLTPVVTATTWSLVIDGMVDAPLRFTYDQLWDRRLVEVDVTLSCVSNEVGGGLVGNARWVGVRLDELLAEAGVGPDADQVMTHSVDGFTAGFPTAALADGRDAIVALTMNGEVLPVAHGYPARLVVPGLYGYVSATKWLSRLELTRFDRAKGFWIPKGWSVQAPVKTQSRIDVPRNRDTVSASRAVLAGVAWAPDRGVQRVEVQLDDGPWLEATLGPQLGASAWRQWWLGWPERPTQARAPGTHRLRCRATDGTGATQTSERAEPAPDGATGWHTIEVQLSN